MPGGYAGKFLDVDLTKGKIKDVNFSDEILEQYFGGRGLGAKILWDRVGKAAASAHRVALLRTIRRQWSR